MIWEGKKKKLEVVEVKLKFRWAFVAKEFNRKHNWLHLVSIKFHG